MDGERQAERLAARAAAVGGVLAVAADRRQLPVFDVGEQAAADAAVRALGRDGLHCIHPAAGPFPGNVAAMNAV
jgi:hypothetical protein